MNEQIELNGQVWTTDEPTWQLLKSWRAERSVYARSVALGIFELGCKLHRIQLCDNVT